MIDPWESLKVNERRQLLGGVNALNGNGGPEIELYDISGDCRSPQLLTGAQVGLDDGTGQYVAAVRGHEGNFSPDGLTYYAANLGNGYIYPIDITNTTKPKMLTQYLTSPGRVHGLNISDDGNRAYLAILGTGPGESRPRGRVAAATTVSRSSTSSEVQARMPNPQISVVGQVMWDDGGGAQHAIDVMIKGKPYVIHVDEAGSGGNSSAGWTCGLQHEPAGLAIRADHRHLRRDQADRRLEADARGVRPEELRARCCPTSPASALHLRRALLQRRQQEERDDAGLRLLQLGHPGVRHPQPGAAEGDRVLQSAAARRRRAPDRTTTAPAAGSPAAPTGAPRRSGSTSRRGTLQTMCQDNGFLTLKFTNGVWPFPESTTPPGTAELEACGPI